MSKIRVGSLVIVHRGPYKSPRRVRVYSIEHNRLRHLIYVTLTGGAGVSTPRSNVRLATDQKEPKDMLVKRLSRDLSSWQACGAPIARIQLIRKQLNTINQEMS